MPQPFIVRRSRIHGRGAFAARPIRAGECVVEYRGERLTGDEAAERGADHDGGHTMLFEVDDDLVIDGARRGNDARFINHSCAPNCAAEIRDRRVFIVALRAIAPGEELVFDYGLLVDGPYRQVWRGRYRCACGAARCRGTMLRLRAQNRVGPMYERLVRARRERAQARDRLNKPPSTRVASPTGRPTLAACTRSRGCNGRRWP